MNRQEAIEILRKHNAWRRYDGPIGEGPEMVNPKTLGEAIDEVCDSEPRWRPITQHPKCQFMMEVLMARFRGNRLETIEHGFFYADDGDGYNDAYFAPSRGEGFTHWMPYEEYWKFMRELPKE